MRNKWLISINPSHGAKACDPDHVTRLHGPFDTDRERQQEMGTIASELAYPDDLVFAAFDIVDGVPILARE